MSVHLAFADDTTVCYCPETEYSEPLVDFAAQYEADGYGCCGCWEQIADDLPLAHHTYTNMDTAEVWNCHGLPSETDDATCLGCMEPIGANA